MPMFHPRQVFSVFFAALVCVVFNISFAAIVYSGDLTPYLQRGIGLTLLGSVVLGTLGAFFLSYRGSIIQAQDAPAILLSGSVATLVSQGQLDGEALFATVAALVFVTSLACGISSLAIGNWKLALLARYIPFPVLAGFLAATGVLLFKGGVELAIGSGLNELTFYEFSSRQVVLRWLPVCSAAVLLMIVTRVFHNRMTLPIMLVAIAIGFIALIHTLGLNADEAQAQGFLLGPFPDRGLLEGVSPTVLFEANWVAVLSQIPVVLTVVAIFLIGMTLNASGLELELCEDFELNREASGVGLANSIGAFVGAIPGYHHMGQTLFSNKLGLIGPTAGVSGAIGGIAVLLAGAATLSFLPVGLFATVITFLGLDLIYTWFWANRRKLQIHDYAIVGLIPMTALFFSFLTAIGVGLAVALCIFVISYARHSSIRLQGNVSTRRSFVERPRDQDDALYRVGQQAHFIELTGYIFFGSANALRDNVLTFLDAQTTSSKWLVIDFRHVVGMDVSAIQMLLRLQSDCAQRHVHLVLSGISAATGKKLQPVLDDPATLQFPSLDDALEYVEDSLLSDRSGTDQQQAATILEQIQDLQTEKEMKGYSQTINLKDGETLIEAGTRSTKIYLLVSGQLFVSVSRLGGTAKIVAKIRPGAIVGEMNFYIQGERTANVVAEGAAQVVSIDIQSFEALLGEGSQVVAVFHKAMARQLSNRLQRTTTLLRNVEV